MNKSASIRQRLLNIAKADETITFQTIIIRYIHECILMRLANSNYKDNFYLKGGTLIFALQEEAKRPTKDIDLLGYNISNTKEDILTIFQEIAKIVIDDAVVFNYKKITVESIQGNEKYKGLRVHMEGKFDSIVQRIQIDIGFGDVIIPEPMAIQYPLLLNTDTTLPLKGYTIESIVAEKLQAMCKLSVFNSRMKDFYDVYFLLSQNQCEKELLKQAIVATFERRNTKIDPHVAFMDELIDNDNLRIKWERFLSRNSLELEVSLNQIVIFIQKNIKKLF